ncbi:translation initiation factor IF-2 subunit alpha [Candidatus Woesearchaeota archaeon]|nr:translation initiation factor IF-2 subunit alpha [Candidatus Woesearchaeota archaeon]
MLYKKTGFPEEGELVLCHVTSVQHHSVFVQMPEYGKGGMIHISEVAPGRIRNIREYVKEGKMVVCKVLRVNQERGHVDLSLRRVTETQRRQKVDELKQEQKAEKIVEGIAKELKKPFEELYQVIIAAVCKEYPYLYLCFEDVAKGEADLEKLGLEKSLAAKLTEVIKQRIRPVEVFIEGNLSLSSYAPNGIETIKSILIGLEQHGITIFYLGGGKYRLDLKAGDYKTAEEKMRKLTHAAVEKISEAQGEGSFVRVETK